MDKPFLALAGVCVLVLVGAFWMSKTATSRAVLSAHADGMETQRRQADLARIQVMLQEAVTVKDRFFVIAVNVGERLDDLKACLDFAWAVCREDGEVVCGMDVTADCSFTCCPKDGSE